MTQQVRVKKVYADGTAQVILIRQSACSGDCHKCSGCGAAQETLELAVRNPIGARTGDLVNIEARSGPVLLAAAVMYIIPLILFFVGYAIGAMWNVGALAGCAAFVLGIAAAVAYDRCIVKKQQTVYTITGYTIS